MMVRYGNRKKEKLEKIRKKGGLGMLCVNCYWCQLCGFHNDVKCYNPESHYYKKKVYRNSGCGSGETEKDIRYRKKERY